ncbi:hypothetical protein AHAS_Ahas04G0104400 [Arachis hypogaea]
MSWMQSQYIDNRVIKCCLMKINATVNTSKRFIFLVDMFMCTMCIAWNLFLEFTEWSLDQLVTRMTG